jgi:H+-transporting ATPase
MAVHRAVEITAPPAESVRKIISNGITSAEAHNRLQKDGPNAMPNVSAHPLRNAWGKFWAPVPWLLEAAIVLQVVLHKYAEAAVTTKTSQGLYRRLRS